MTKKRITSQDVANLANVSRTTVSLVLNEVEGISIPVSTREKVRQATKELGYIPNVAAQALASQRAKAIGLVMTRSPQLISSDTFLPQIIGGLLEVVKKEKFRLLIEIVNEEHHENAYVELAQAKHIDGMIILTPRTTDDGLRRLKELEIPAVLFGHLPDCELASVQIDNIEGAYKATEYLISLGHKNIACILNAPLSYSTAQDRLLGYKNALKVANIPFNESLIKFGNFSPESGFSAMNAILSSNASFSAVFVASDNVAAGAKAALRDADFRIPDDISMIGFDDIPWSAYSDPPLTTIRIPAQDMASKACLLLLDIIRDKDIENTKQFIETELVVRQSCQEKK